MCDKCGCGEAKTEDSFEEKVKEVIESVRPALQGPGFALVTQGGGRGEGLTAPSFGTAQDIAQQRCWLFGRHKKIKKIGKILRKHHVLAQKNG